MLQPSILSLKCRSGFNERFLVCKELNMCFGPLQASLAIASLALHTYNMCQPYTGSCTKRIRWYHCSNCRWTQTAAQVMDSEAAEGGLTLCLCSKRRMSCLGMRRQSRTCYLRHTACVAKMSNKDKQDLGEKFEPHLHVQRWMGTSQACRQSVPKNASKTSAK